MWETGSGAGGKEGVTNAKRLRKEKEQGEACISILWGPWTIMLLTRKLPRGKLTGMKVREPEKAESRALSNYGRGGEASLPHQNRK